MSRTFALAILCLATGTAIDLRGQDGKGDLDKLKGEWSVTAMEIAEKQSPKKNIETLVVTFTEEKMTLSRGGGKAKEYTFKINSTKTPKRIDLVPLDGKSKGLTVFGIYQFNGKDLKICMPNSDGTERPTEFKTEKDSDLILMSLTPKK